MPKELYSGWDHTFAAFKHVLASASDVLDASQIPFAKTAPDIISQIIDITESTKKNKKECEELTIRTKELVSMINENCLVQDAGGGQNILNNYGIRKLTDHAEELEKTLLSVKKTVESIKKMRWFKQMLQHKSIQSHMSDCNTKLDRAIDLFSAKNILNIDKKVMNIEEKLMLLVQANDATTNDASGSDSHMLDREPPFTPSVFYGRKDYVQSAVSHIIASHPVRLPILGPGGIGKTTVAEAIISHDDIQAEFSSNRYFIRCSTLSSALQMVQMMCQIIIGPDGLKSNEENPLGLLFQHLKAMSKALIILDNFETMWHMEDQREIKDILNRLARVKCLTLLITMRGTAPETILWSKDEAAKELPALDPESAQQMFQSLCRNFEDSPENNADLSALVKQLDYVPLAISIVAQMASLESATPKEVSENIVHYLKTLRDGPSDSIKASVSLSLNSYLVKNNPACVDLLKIIAYLPSGISTDFIKEMAHVQDAKRVAAVLMAVGLVHRGGRMLNILSPIRLYIQEDYPLVVTDKKYIFEYYFKLCDECSSNDAWESSETRDHLAAEEANCFRVLSDTLEYYRNVEGDNGLLQNKANGLENDADDSRETEKKNNRHLQAIYDYTYFLFFASISSLELFKLAESDFENCDDSSLKGFYYKLFGTMLRFQSKHKEAMDHVLKAREVFERIGEKRGTAECLQEIGDIARMQGRYEEAKDALLKAKKEFEEIGSRLGAAQCLQSIGDIALMQSRYEEARDALSQAKEEFEGIGDRLGAAQCLQSIGNIASMQGRYEQAVHALTRAKEEFEGIGYRLGAAQCLQSIGNIARVQSRYEEASDALTRAKEEFEAIGSRLGAAQCLQSIGDIARVQSRYEEASDALTRAKEEFEAIGSRLGAAQCLQSIGDIACMQNRYKEASDALTRAKEEFEDIGSRLGAAQCLWSIGNIAHMQNRYEEARDALSEAKEEFEDIGNRLGAAQCLQRIGEIARMQDRYEEARDALARAKEEFEGIGGRLGAAQCLRSIGDIACMQGRYEEAYYALSKAKKEFGDIGERLGAAQCLQSIGEIARMRGSYEEAMDALSRAKEGFEDIGSRLGAAQCLRSIGSIFREQDRYKEAGDALLNAKEMFREVGDSLGIAQCIEFLGVVTIDQGDYSEAEGMLRQALEMQESIGLPREIARCRIWLDKLMELMNQTNGDQE